MIRILLAWFLLVLIQHAITGAWIPRADSAGLMLLALSGIIGFAIGDQFLFIALVDVGPRLTTLLMTLTPPVAAALAWPVLNEPLSLLAMGGIAVTLAGIGWVAVERPDPTAKRPHPHRWRGLLFGALAATCQAMGLILSKLGMGHARLPADMHMQPWSASLVRVTFGAAAICALAAIHRAGRSAAATGAPMEREVNLASQQSTASVVPTALLMLSIGTVLGPVVGVYFSLVAIDKAPAGIAATLMAMTPVFILPLAVVIERERLSWRAVAGAAIAVAGVAILTGFNA